MKFQSQADHNPQHLSVMLEGSFLYPEPRNCSCLYLLSLLVNNTPCFKGFGITQLITGRHGAKYTSQCKKGASRLTDGNIPTVYEHLGRRGCTQLRGAEHYSRDPQSLGHSIVSQQFMEPEGSIPNSQELSTCPYPEPDQSSPRHPIPPLQNGTEAHGTYSNIVLKTITPLP
jgi:hypothetical protein